MQATCVSSNTISAFKVINTSNVWYFRYFKILGTHLCSTILSTCQTEYHLIGISFALQRPYEIHSSMSIHEGKQNQCFIDTAAYFVKIIWCSHWFCTLALSFEAVYCFICSCQRVAVARYRMFCLVLLNLILCYRDLTRYIPVHPYMKWSKCFTEFHLRYRDLKKEIPAPPYMRWSKYFTEFHLRYRDLTRYIPVHQYTR